MPTHVAQRVPATGRPIGERAAADQIEPEALSVTHWFESEPDGEPYTATIRFSGRRMGVTGKAGPRDAFVKEEIVKEVVPGSGPVSITALVYGLEPGEWSVTADLHRRSAGAGARWAAGGKTHGTQTLPRAGWSWRRWSLSTAQFRPVTTRWAPMVRMTRVPAVVHGSWSGLIAAGVVVGAVVQTALLAQSGVAIGQTLLVDALALIAGGVGAKLWQLVAGPRGSLRGPITEGWTVDGLIVGAALAGVAFLLAFGLPVGVFLDASAPSLFFGVAIGRLGCFFTGCCAGRCTRSRWGIWSSDRRVGARRIPTQLLESAVGLLIGVATIVAFIRFSPNIGGTIFVAAFAAYVLVRQFLVRLRAEPHDRTRARITAAVAALVLLADAVVLFAGAT